MSRRKKALIWTACAAAFIALMASPLAASLRSMAVMSVYSAREEKESVQAERGIDIKIPSGKGWHPLVMTHNADAAFERLTGQEGARLTILYNIPAFDALRGCSRLFDESSPYYNSFYGAYLTSLPDGGSYGFDPEGVSIDEAVSSMARLDFFGLVLGDFGLAAAERVFEYTVKSERPDVEFAGYDGWTRIDAVMRVNGAAHTAASGVRSYWQYGKPGFPAARDFAPVDMECTVFAKFFEEWETTVYFYVMAADEQVRDDCADNILARSVVRAE